jgi:hypothetical protein
LRGGDFVIRQCAAHLQRNAFVQQDFHAASSLSIR